MKYLQYLSILELVPAKTLVVYDLFKFLEGADGSISPDRIKMDLQLLLWHCRTNSFEKGKRTIMELWDQFECKKCYIFKARLNISNLGPNGKMSKSVEKTGTMIPPEKMFIKYWDIKPFESTSRWIRNCKMFGHYKIIQDRSCSDQAYV